MLSSSPLASYVCVVALVGGFEQEALLGTDTPDAAVQQSSSKLLPPVSLYIDVVVYCFGSVYEITFPTESVEIDAVSEFGPLTASMMGASGSEFPGSV